VLIFLPLSGLPMHSVISTLCNSFVFSTNLRVRIYKTILVRVSRSQIRKIKMAAIIQNGGQFPAFCRITPHNFCTIEHKIAILVCIHTFACISNWLKIKANMMGAYLLLYWVTQGGPKSKSLSNYKKSYKIVLMPVKEITFLRQIKY